MRIQSLALGVLLLMPLQVSAAPIGLFVWEHELEFGFGSGFKVFNESNDPFTDLLVNLFGPGELDPFQSLILDDVAPGESTQSFDDLSFILVPFDLDRVVLRLTFGGSALTASLMASALGGDPASFLSASTEIVGPDPNPTPVPEPTTLLLLATGMGVVALGGLRGRFNLGVSLEPEEHSNR